MLDGTARSKRREIQGLEAAIQQSLIDRYRYGGLGAAEKHFADRSSSLGERKFPEGRRFPEFPDSGLLRVGALGNHRGAPDSRLVLWQEVWCSSLPVPSRILAERRGVEQDLEST